MTGAGESDDAVGERQVPFFCPYCGEEELRPAGSKAGDWAMPVVLTRLHAALHRSHRSRGRGSRCGRLASRGHRMSGYPVELDLGGRDVVVVGGGAVALRRARALVDAGARVTVIAPE